MLLSRGFVGRGGDLRLRELLLTSSTLFAEQPGCLVLVVQVGGFPSGLGSGRTTFLVFGVVRLILRHDYLGWLVDAPVRPDARLELCHSEFRLLAQKPLGTRANESRCVGHYDQRNDDTGGDDKADDNVTVRHFITSLLSPG